jgi:hypothetical protein
VLGTSWALRTFWWTPLPGAAVSLFYLGRAINAAGDVTRGPSADAVIKECSELPMEGAFARYRELIYEAIFFNAYVGQQQGKFLRKGIWALLVTVAYSVGLSLLLR